MHVLLSVVLGLLCAAVGFMGLSLIGHTFLRLCGVSNERYYAWKVAALALGLPAAIVGFLIGYNIGAGLVL